MSNLDFTAELILLGLKEGKEKGRTSSELKKSFKPIFDRNSSELSSALPRLVADGHAEELPRKKGQRSSRWRLMPSGEEALHGRFGAGPMKGRFAKRNSVRLLAAVHILKLEPRKAAAVVEGDGLFAYFLSERLGEKFDATTTVEGLARQAAAKALDLPRSDLDFVWGHLLQKEFGARNPTETQTVSTGPVRNPLTIAEFADEVKQAARAAKVGWFGPQKLFIHRAWEVWKTISGESIDLLAFKQRLLEALRAGHVELARADYPLSLAAEDLEMALTLYGNETYHFITLATEVQS